MSHLPQLGRISNTEEFRSMDTSNSVENSEGQ